MLQALTPVIQIRLLLLIFFCSGFAGLIYQSIWTHYLKLFLGHAAYAQTLVLSIFMLGMAVGSWWAGRLSHRSRRLLLLYAAAELVLGFFALLFHDASRFVIQWFFEQLAPQFSSVIGVNVAKWLLAALLIVPQSILIGMTFPLMANGLLRLCNENQGRLLANLYFVNSLGAAMGVLASGFWLIAAVGLPGANAVSGGVNIAIAMLVFVLCHRSETAVFKVLTVSQPLDRQGWLLMAVAGLTGLASFVYEIVWIRLLSQLLGSATHSFELMLSAFIFGLALGGLFIRTRIDRLKNPLNTLAIIQVLMGLIAFASLYFYNAAFDWLALVIQTLAATAAGYVGFNLISHLICLLIMLPATICAGMTLPIIIKLLLQRHNESSVGNVYAINTVGSILGVLLAVHVLLPNVGAFNSMALAALLDILLGVVVLGFAKAYSSLMASAITAGVALLFSSFYIVLNLDLNKLTSGVFLEGQLGHTQAVTFFQDGKTSSVALKEYDDGLIILSTNGKPDASMYPAPKSSPDESTQTLSGLLPLLLANQKQQVAIVGFGSGMSTHAVLTDPDVAQVTTIEIEPAIVDAARAFYEKSYLAFDDPRSVIVYEDAKTWFASRQQRHDLIIAEPSNPWVSGVSSLFTTEFYQHIRRYLKQDGVFAQWIQTYEISPELLASIANALGQNFAYYDIYNTGNNDLLFVASDKPIKPLQQQSLSPAMLKVLAPLNIHQALDLASLRVASKAQLAPVFQRFSTQINSDYYPIVDQQAVRARFLNQQSGGVFQLLYGGLPLAGTVLDERAYTPVQAIATVLYGKDQQLAMRFYQQQLGEGVSAGQTHGEQIFNLTRHQCNEDAKVLFWKSFPDLFKQLVSQLAAPQLVQLWGVIQNHACLQSAHYPADDLTSFHLIKLLTAIAQRDFKQIQLFSGILMLDDKALAVLSGRYLPMLWLLATIQLHDSVSKPSFELASLLANNPDQNWLAYLLLDRYQQMQKTRD